jgi:general stress protein 26
MKSALISLSFLLLATGIISSDLCAQPLYNRDTIFIASREIIKETTYCGLITVDSTGQPQVRTMNPFPVNDELITWFATARSSRKIREIRNNPMVSVYFADHNTAKGYVTITGEAEVIDDIELLTQMKRDYWEGIPDWQNIFVLIKIVPKTIEVINYKHGLNNAKMTFGAPKIVL